MISFVTCVKLMHGYEDYVFRLQMYVECIAAYCALPYEIIVVEDVCDRNVARVGDTLSNEWLEQRHARLVAYAATYANPHGYNMIEAYAKNAGLRETRFDFVCMTNCDVTFNREFFEWLPEMKPHVFYRSMQYESHAPETWTLDAVERTYASAKCLNSLLADRSNWTLKNIAYKSGDVMVLDRESWMQVGGFPENNVWVHSDLVVCKVVYNNCIPVDMCGGATYTVTQARTYEAQAFELAKAYEYYERRTCN